MLRYAITAGDYGLRPDKTVPLLEQVRHLAQSGVEYVQLREKQLSAGELTHLARQILVLLAGSNTRLLLNSRADAALAAGAHGVHLPAAPGNLTPTQIRHLYRAQGLPEPVVSQACHTRAEVMAAHRDPPHLILFSPVFGKTLHFTEGRHELPGTGLGELATVCALAHPIPVFALGGVTAANTPSCLEAGAAGVAGIRLFETVVSSKL